MRVSTSPGVGALSMQVLSAPLDQVATAIGRSVCWRGSIEFALRSLCVDLAGFRDLSFTGAKAREALEITLSHGDTRQRIAAAKALAFETMDPDTYDEIERLLNVIDNKLRQKRNRFAHDEWEIDGDEIVQRKHGAIVKNVQSRERKMLWSIEARYGSVDEVHAFATEVSKALQDLRALDLQLTCFGRYGRLKNGRIKLPRTENAHRVVRSVDDLAWQPRTDHCFSACFTVTDASASNLEITPDRMRALTDI